MRDDFPKFRIISTMYTWLPDDGPVIRIYDRWHGDLVWIVYEPYAGTMLSQTRDHLIRCGVKPDEIVGMTSANEIGFHDSLIVKQFHTHVTVRMNGVVKVIRGPRYF